jgi:hypothetical protein
MARNVCTPLWLFDPVEYHIQMEGSGLIEPVRLYIPIMVEFQVKGGNDFEKNAILN